MKSTATAGIFEQLLTDALRARIETIPGNLIVECDPLRVAEAPDRLAWHISQVVTKALESIPEDQRVAKGIELIRELVMAIAGAVPRSNCQSEVPTLEGEILSAVVERLPDGSAGKMDRPLIPLLDTTLLTNAPGEPRVGHQLLAEIDSADRIDALMAFVRVTGINPMLGKLRRHCERGRALRVLTTIYTGSTEPRALDMLADAGADVRVSYDTTTTRLHAKAWIFRRLSGFSTAYVGSSNLTHSAQVTGLEWNVRVSAARNPSVTEKMEAVFESYWNSPDFRPYDPEEFARLAASRKAIDVLLSPIEIRLEPFQERLLEQIAVARQSGRHRNLLVSATGTGKTVMAAVDYARLCRRLPRARLLFVAHREEILAQSLATFRHALREPSFGELWVGGRRPRDFDHVFASIQSLASADLGLIEPQRFDVVIVDEFHHAAASSYERLLSHLRPTELIGLTATPERADGRSVLHWFDDRIAAELRLWDAIDQRRLVPFAYYGVHDGVDFREVPWKRGYGYDVEGLTNVLTGNDAAARLVLKELSHRIGDLGRMRALGFCVSVAHARFMARIFNAAGVRSAAVWADTPEQERRIALADLKDQKINVLFSVDLFNEGVDLPAVDTLLLLRPTDSATLFLQQLGRGLRISEDKSICTVLDFVAQHRREFRFDRRMRALIGGTRRDVEKQVERGFPFLPAGCHMELDRVATDIVLNNIRAAVPTNWRRRVEELVSIAKTGQPVSLEGFLGESGLELADLYSNNRSWSDLREAAGLSVEPAGEYEVALRRACGRILHVDDPARLNTWVDWLSRPEPPISDELSAHDRGLLRMLLVSMLDSVKGVNFEVDNGCTALWSHPQVVAELRELMGVLSGHIGHITDRLAVRKELPLRVHARYTRAEILAAFSVDNRLRMPEWREGVRWVSDANVDLFAVTLDKSSGDFSPTTRYRDYAISPELIHWESQSTTGEDSETGRRYREHAARGSDVLLFARLRADERAYIFLGSATYVSHVGSRPMAITWRLDTPLSGDLYASFAAAVA